MMKLPKFKFPKLKSPRGQALTETAIALPLFLMGLFGVIWAIREGAMSERVQLSVRYGGVLSSMSNPYQDYSLYAIYATIDGLPPTSYATCAPYETGMPGIITNTREGLFQPDAAPAASCYGGLAVVDSPETYSQPVMLQDDAAFMTAANPSGGFLAATLQGASTSNSAVQNFFKSPDLEALTQCTEVGEAFRNSAEGFADTTSATTPPSPLPATLAPEAPVAISSAGSPVCVSYTPPAAIPTPSATPSPSPSPSPTPTRSPSPSPSPTPTWTPSASPSPTPTWTPSRSPSPTPSPSPTASPTGSPSPTPTWTPSASPSPTPTWTPSASPSPTASPTTAPTPTPSPTAVPTASPTAAPTSTPTTYGGPTF